MHFLPFCPIHNRNVHTTKRAAAATTFQKQKNILKEVGWFVSRPIRVQMDWSPFGTTLVVTNKQTKTIIDLHYDCLLSFANGRMENIKKENKN